MAETPLEQGIKAFKAGDQAKARRLLFAATQQDPDNERAWGWLYNASDMDVDRIVCLKNMLRINPKNDKADKLFQKFIKDEPPLEYPLYDPISSSKKPAKQLPNPIWTMLLAALFLMILCIVVSTVYYVFFVRSATG